MRAFSWAEGNDHFLVRADARIKLLSTAALLVMVLTCKAALFPLLVVTLCLSLCAFMGVPAKKVLLRFAEPAFIVLVLVLLKFLLSGKEVVGTVHVLGLAISGYREGLSEGLLLACRIMAAVSLVAVLGFATPFTTLLGALAWLRLPKGLVEVSIFAYRYIFLLLDDATVIYNAQKNRLGYSSVRRGFNSFGVLAGSLTLKAFESSQQAALAMVQRGYDGTMPLAGQKDLKASQVTGWAFFLLLMGLLWKLQ